MPRSAWAGRHNNTTRLCGAALWGRPVWQLAFAGNETASLLRKDVQVEHHEAQADSLLFCNVVAAIDIGDLTAMDGMLRKDPSIVGYHCRSGQWYENGYFKAATLLHHVAGNPIRSPISRNVVDVARMLLDFGADPNAETDAGWTTIGLLLTSKQASESGVAMALIDLLRTAGATDEVGTQRALTWALLNCAPETAAALVQRGAPMDLRHAAGLGRVDELRDLIAVGSHQPLCEEALVFACIRGQVEAARILVEYDAKGDVLLAPGGQSPRTAMHEAANRGHLEIVRLLIDNGADTSVVEPLWGGTAAGWARHGGHTEMAELLERMNGRS